MNKQKEEEKYKKTLDILEEIDCLQKQALIHYDEGMTCFAYAKFQNLQINPNLLSITPALIKIENFEPVESDRTKFGIIPIFDESNCWDAINEVEYQKETQDFFEQNSQNTVSVFNVMNLDENIPALHKVQQEFTHTLRCYLKIVKIIQNLKNQ